MLRKLNKNSDYPLRIRDPDDPNIIIDDPVKIKETLTKYWSSLGNGSESEKDESERVNNLKTMSHNPNSSSNEVLLHMGKVTFPSTLFTYYVSMRQ